MTSSHSSPGGPALVVALGTRRCALDVRHVVETMRPLPLEPVAHAPPFVRGMSIIRGEPVPVVDLLQILGGAQASVETARWVTVRAGPHQVALAVDGVLGVARIDGGHAGDLPPLLRDANTSALEAMGTLDDALLLVLNAARLVPETLWASLPGGAVE